VEDPVKKVQLAAAVAIGLIVLVTAAAAILKPYIPMLVVLFFLACLFRLILRDR